MELLQRMTATAVAREKAQLYADFARLKSDQGQELGEAELLELESLRHRSVIDAQHVRGHERHRPTPKK